VKRLRLVVFDLDGTLVDSSGDLCGALNTTLGRIGPGTPPLTNAAVRKMIGSGARVLVARGLEATGLDADPDLALEVFLESYRSRLLEATQLYPGVREILDTLREKTLAVLTNKPGDLSRTILKGLGVADRFARICGAGDGQPKKPDPEALRWLMRELDVPASATGLVGDSGLDVETGRAASVATIGIRSGFDPDGVAAARPDRLVDDVGGVLPALRDLFAR
jgi:phosphoglycolate phosphatase